MQTNDLILMCQMLAVERLMGETTARQIAVLTYVNFNPGLSVKDIAAALGVQKPSITRAIDRLAADGLMSRTHSEIDRRTISVRLTNLGSQVLDRILAGNTDPMDKAA